ncbi:hypothetical protein ACYFX5_07835 [Bremerella sp. T1]|uniref:hypothetical protein n=1 Tax=Bremerella sp. TYQ1 TaxID=3119568 RepID=UPI001CC99BE4|nr:hypothetical protein [Bremerella volcania]UBM38167.1 hypothetical protein LA756_09770 [Bremerella volcania]
MTRTADYTIQGFLYQFNKTVLEILAAQDDDTITIEGVVEDIEVSNTTSTRAIQCKYHETHTSFSESAIYKPLLQMLKHYHDNSTADVRYVLFAHFQGVKEPYPNVDKSTLQSALGSRDQTLKKHIMAIPTTVNLDAFIKRFEMKFGPTYDVLSKDVVNALKTNGFPEDDIEILAYPNAIHKVATFSIKHSQSERQTTKKEFLEELKAIRTTAISRWTLALKSRDKVLIARRKQLKAHLDKNSRLRYFAIDLGSIVDYKDDIVLFIKNYLDKYHFKPAHTHTPVMCLRADHATIQQIKHRLYKKGILVTDGYIGPEFEAAHFFRDPLVAKEVGGTPKREFSLRILSWDHCRHMNNRKCDDVFIIGDLDISPLDTKDVNVERLAGATVKEVEFILGISNVYE